MLARQDMDPFNSVVLRQFPEPSESEYQPPLVEGIVTAAELERESLYAGDGAYGIT